MKSKDIFGVEIQICNKAHKQISKQNQLDPSWLDKVIKNESSNPMAVGEALCKTRLAGVNGQWINKPIT